MTLRNLYFILLVAAALPAACLAARAQDAELKGVAEVRPTVTIKIDRGSIQVQGTAGLDQIRWTVREQRRNRNGGHGPASSTGQDAVRAKSSGGTLELEGEDADIRVNVPLKMIRIVLRTESGDVSLSDVAARADIATGAGRVDLAGVGGSIQAETGGGNIAARNSGASGSLMSLRTGGGNVFIDAAGGDVFAETGGGNIEVTAARGNIRVEDGGGNVKVRQAGGNALLETNSGNVEMGDIGGDVQARTGSGTIRLASARGMVRAETGSGEINCRQLGAGLKALTGSGAITAEYSRNLHFAESRLETGSGDVTVFMPDGVAAALKATAENPWGHMIHADFSAIRITADNSTLQAEGRMNGGGPLLRVITGNGNVTLLREK